MREVFDGGFGDYLSTAFYSNALTPVSYETAFDYSDIVYDLDDAVLDPGFDFDVYGAIPQLNSNPGAAHTLFLDFDGNFESFWASDGFEFTNTTMPGFDVDNIPGGYSAFERAIISDVFRYVAEDFAPFDVNVTTVDPGGWDNADGRQLKVVIGRYQGDMVVSNPDEVSQAAWNVGQSGYGTLGGFSDADSNTVFVFGATFGNTATRRTPISPPSSPARPRTRLGTAWACSMCTISTPTATSPTPTVKGAPIGLRSWGTTWRPIAPSGRGGPIGSGNPAPMQNDAAMLQKRARSAGGRPCQRALQRDLARQFVTAGEHFSTLFGQRNHRDDCRC